MDEFFPKDVRSRAEGLFNVLILGVGPFVANFLCGRLKTAYTTDNVLHYRAVFQYSMAAALVGAVLMALLFHPRKAAEDPGLRGPKRMPRRRRSHQGKRDRPGPPESRQSSKLFLSP